MERAVTEAEGASGPVALQVVPDVGGGSLTCKVVLATRSPGLLQSLTARCPSLVVDAYLLGPHLVLQAFGSEADLNEAQGALLAMDSALHTVTADGRMTFVLEGAEPEEEVIRLLAQRAAHVVPPVRWAGGEARVTLLVGEAADLQEVQALFPDARLLSKRAVASESAVREALGSPLFLPNLTRKQARALQAAFDAGYYDFPRRVTMDEVSQALAISRSTFQEHLHRAEAHLIRAMLPLVRIKASGSDGASPGPAGEALALYSRFSQELGLYVQLEVLGDRVRRVRLAPERPKEGETSHPYLTRILEHIRTGEGDLSDIPVDFQVGPFDREVLAYLRTLRPGTTITYGEIARHLGRPRASRAVGNACRRNPVPVIIPCHRVVPVTGGLGGYSGGSGAATKRELLEREGADVSSLGSGGPQARVPWGRPT
ncbi:MAG: methylated-DNA--[protein]-cysteine S-methyltransferase [Thermoplasmata archaeon]